MCCSIFVFQCFHELIKSRSHKYLENKYPFWSQVSIYESHDTFQHIDTPDRIQISIARRIWRHIAQDTVECRDVMSSQNLSDNVTISRVSYIRGDAWQGNLYRFQVDTDDRRSRMMLRFQSL